MCCAALRERRSQHLRNDALDHKQISIRGLHQANKCGRECSGSQCRAKQNECPGLIKLKRRHRRPPHRCNSRAAAFNARRNLIAKILPKRHVRLIAAAYGARELAAPCNRFRFQSEGRGLLATARRSVGPVSSRPDSSRPRSAADPACDLRGCRGQPRS